LAGFGESVWRWYTANGPPRYFGGI